MGAAASAGVLPEDVEEAAIYKELSAEYETRTNGSTLSESEVASVYAQLRAEYAAQVRILKDRAAWAVGDVVQAKVDGIFFEGVLTSLEAEASATVSFGDDDSQVVQLTECRRVYAWDAVEVGDTVQVRDRKNPHMTYEAIVSGVASDPFCEEQSYTVDYAVPANDFDRAPSEADVEYGVAFGRLRKMKSARLLTQDKWKKAFKVVNAVNRFRSRSVSMDSIPNGQKPGDGATAQGDNQANNIFRFRKTSSLQHMPEDGEPLAYRPKTPDLPTVPGAPAPGAPAPGAPPLHVGDIVRARADGECLAFEGVVVELDSPNNLALVHFGGSSKEDDDDGHEAEWISAAACQKVLNWNVCEVGDYVKAQPLGDAIWYQGTIVDVSTAEFDGMPTYSVSWGHDGDDDCEHNVTPDRIRKVTSARTHVVKARWKMVNRMVTGSNAFRKAREESQEGREAESLPKVAALDLKGNRRNAEAKDGGDDDSERKEAK